MHIHSTLFLHTSFNSIVRVNNLSFSWSTILATRYMLRIAGESRFSTGKLIVQRLYKHTTMATFTIPHDFLSSPGPRVQKNDVDFKYHGLPEYEGRYATVLDNVFTKDECDILVRAAEAQSNGTWEQAMINIGGGAQALMTDSRDCGRIIWDDKDVVERIWSRIKGSVPEPNYLMGMDKVTAVPRGEMWEMTRLNERMRFLKYGKGQYFKRKQYPSLSSTRFTDSCSAL